jgi:hypothetical protein
MLQRSKRNYSGDLPRFRIGVFCPNNQADSEFKNSRGAAQICDRNGASEALLPANFSKLFRTACFGLPTLVTVSIMVAMFPMISASPAFPTSPTFPTSRENTPGGGEQGDDGH